MKVIEVNQASFEAEVINSDVPVLADFNAEWCGPCQAMKPMLDEISESDPGYKIVSINIDDEDELAEEYEITSIPCLVVFKNGKEFNRSVGLMSRDDIAALMED